MTKTFTLGVPTACMYCGTRLEEGARVIEGKDFEIYGLDCHRKYPRVYRGHEEAAKIHAEFDRGWREKVET